MTDTTPVKIIASWCGGLNSSQRDKDWIAGQAIEALTAAGKIIVDKEPSEARIEAGWSAIPYGLFPGKSREEIEAIIPAIYRAMTKDTGS